MRELRTTAVAVFAFALFCGACATTPAPGTYVPEELNFNAGRSDPTLRVTNNNWSTMTVYAIRGGTRFRLGQVPSMGSAVFRLPSTLTAGTGGLRFLADPIGGSETFLSQNIYVNGGEQVALDIQNQLQISSVSIWNRP